MMTIGKTAIALGIAGAALTAAPSFAGPLPSSAAALQQAGVSAGVNNVEQVQWRGRGWHGHRGGWGGPWAGAGVGFAAGALVGSAIASSNYYGGYYGGGPYAYGGGPYAYYDEPVYAAPAPVYRRVVPGGRCWITTGGNGQYGYWAAC